MSTSWSRPSAHGGDEHHYQAEEDKSRLQGVSDNSPFIQAVMGLVDQVEQRLRPNEEDSVKPDFNGSRA